MKYSRNEVVEKMYSAVICDILDTMGYRNQAMNDSIKPLDNNMVVFGKAFTVLACDVYAEPEMPYKGELESVDHLSEGDVMVVNTNGSTSCGFWGELLTTVAVCRKAVGAVIDGMTRDTRQIREMKFPLFARGTNPLDSKGRADVIAYKVPVECGGVLVNPGDYIFGDSDGIVVIPQNIIDEVLEKSFEKINGENTVRDEILNGASATEVFYKYHIL